MAEKKKKNNKFVKWLQAEKVEVLAVKLGVGARIIYKWKSGEGRPSLDTAHAILHLAEGQLELEDLL